jgi:hypothetical protein
MTRSKPLSLAFPLGLALFVFLGGPTAAQQFSADINYADANGSSRGQGKIYVSGSKVRLEIPDIRGGFFLLDGERDTAFFIRPAQHVFMDAKQTSRLTQIFVPVDPSEPCHKWRDMAIVAGIAAQALPWHCDRIGVEPLRGLAAIRYRIISTDAQANDVWIDSGREFPTQIQMADGTRVDLDNFDETVPPPSLFDIPAGFRKFDPQALIDRIKQSDVWVEPPR